jgi:hypothetical protein
VWIGLIWLNIGTDDGPYVHCNKPLGSVEGRNFLEEFVVLSDCEKGLAPWKWIANSLCKTGLHSAYVIYR